MKLWTEGIVSRVKAFLPAGGRKTVVMAAAGRLWLAKLEEGKYLIKKSTVLSEINEDTLRKAFFTFTDRGDKEITVLYTLSDLRIACKSFPAMTEEELKETMYWEQDRIFGTDTDMRLAWKVLTRDFTGWTVSLAGIKETSFELWQSAAEKGGKKITRMIPVTAIDIPRKQPPMYLYGRGKSALFLFREEARQVSRVLQKETADEKLDTFFRYLGKSCVLQGRDIIFIPMSQSEEIPFWKDLAKRWQEKLKEFSFENGEKVSVDFESLGDEDFYENGELSGDEWKENFSGGTEEISFGETGESMTEEKRENADVGEYEVSGREKSLPEETLWTCILPVMEAVNGSDMDFRGKEKGNAFFPGEMNWLRVGQGLSAFFAVIGILCFLFLGHTLLEERATETKLAELSEVRSEMETERKEQARENALLSQLRSLEEKDPHWEQKLVSLAECIPQGIVLSEIRSDGDGIRLTGTADSSGTAARFQKELGKAWGGKTHIEKQKREPKLKMTVFTLLWEGGAP